MPKSPTAVRSSTRLGEGFGTTTFSGLGVHVSLLWLTVLFVLVSVIVIGYAGQQEHLAKRELPDTDVNGDLKVTGTTKSKKNVVSIAADTTVTAEQSGTMFTISDLDAAITLPSAVAGLHYQFVMEGVANGATITCASGDAFFGNFKVTSTTDDKTSSDQIVTASAATSTPASSNVLTLDGDANTSGGNAGDTIEIVAVNDTLWKVTAVLVTAGSAPAAIAILS